MYTNESSGECQRRQWNTWFFSRGSRACWHASPLCVDHTLGGSWANWHHAKPTLGHRKNLPEVRVTQWQKQSNRVPFGSPPGKGQEPLTNHREMATNNHQLVPMLLHYSKPSRWRQPPRVTRKPQPQRSQVPLDAITQANALGIIPNLTIMMNQWWKWVGGVCLGSQECITDENVQVRQLQPCLFYL
jgi:hypothetical protein